MYSQTLPHLLGGVRSPALVVWGDDDRIVPRSAGERYVAGAARRAAGDRARLRPLRRDGKAGRAGRLIERSSTRIDASRGLEGATPCT